MTKQELMIQIRSSDLSQEQKNKLFQELAKTTDPKKIAEKLKKEKPSKKSPKKEDEPKKVRARDEKGRLVGDDPSTPDVDEAWVEAKPFQPKSNKKQGLSDAK